MRDITIDDIDRAIHILKLRAFEQQKLLSTTDNDELADQLRPAHAHLVENIHRMTSIRDGLLVDEPQGMMH